MLAAQVHTYPKTCVVCGSDYLAYHKKGKYCSAECRTIACNEKRRRDRLEKSKRPKNFWINRCEYCGKSFKAKRKKTKYCGAPCLKKGKSRKNTLKSFCSIKGCLFFLVCRYNVMVVKPMPDTWEPYCFKESKYHELYVNQYGEVEG